jgi:hypothetical protein
MGEALTGRRDAVAAVGRLQQGQPGARSVQRLPAAQVELDAMACATPHPALQAGVVQRRTLLRAAVFQQHRLPLDHQQQQAAPGNLETAPAALVEVDQALQSDEHAPSGGS